MRMDMTCLNLSSSFSFIVTILLLTRLHHSTSNTHHNHNHHHNHHHHHHHNCDASASASSSLSSLLPSSSFLGKGTSLLFGIRGGGDGGSDDDIKERAEREEEDDDDESSDPSSSSLLGSSSSSSSSSNNEPVVVRIKTTVGNELLDEFLDVTVLESRHLFEMKTKLSKQFMGRPPVSILSLRNHHGEALQQSSSASSSTMDETTIHELILEQQQDMEEEDDEEGEQEEEDDEDEGDDKIMLTLLLDMVPPINHKMTTEQLQQKLTRMSTSELINTYTMSESCIYQTDLDIQKYETQIQKVKKQLVRILQPHDEDEEEEEAEESDNDEHDEDEEEQSMISFELRERSKKLRTRIESTLFTKEIIDTLSKEEAEEEEQKKNSHNQDTDATSSSIVVEERGHRSRTFDIGTDGTAASTTTANSFRQAVQHNFNINWSETIRNFFLFLFFGYFGGRTSTSRYVLLSGAPLSILLQARVIKLLWKRILYFILLNPPGILCTLLPAPQQALLNNEHQLATSLQLIYGNDIDLQHYITTTTETEDDVASSFEDHQQEEDDDHDDNYTEEVELEDYSDE